MLDFLQDPKGDNSTMRLIATIATVTACLGLLASGVALFMANPNAVPFATVCGTVIGASVGGKLLQKKIEGPGE
jgi:hypothetical protein